MDFRKCFKGFMAVLFAFCITPALAQTDTARININAPWVDYSTPKEYIIRNIEVTGIKYLDPASVLITAGIIKGDTIMIPGDYLSSALRSLMDRRQFADVQILSRPDGQYVDIDVVLQERPRVFTWKFKGLNKNEEKELNESLKLRRGIELTEFLINSSSDAIKKYLSEEGFMNAEVYIIQEDDPSINANAVSITFDVSKNGKVKVGEIVFEGNEVFTDRRLRRTFKKIRPVSINFFANSKLKEKEFIEDKGNLIDFYQANGYRNAVVVTDSVYQIAPNRVGIKLTVDEGNQFHIRDIRWTGNSVYETELLSNILGISPGDRYDKQAIDKNLGIGKYMSNMETMTVSSLYQNNGYLFSGIEPTETTVGMDSVDLEIRIMEGEQARVNDVTIEGNFRIDDQVIRRELYVRPGELYDRSMLMQTMYQLNSMGHFYPETTVPQINPVSNSNNLVDIGFTLEEQASDQFQLSGGWGAGMFIASVGIQLNNFALKRLFEKNAWRPYPSGQGQQLTLRVQSSGSYYNSISMNFMEPWFGGKRPNAFSVGLFYSSQDDSYWIGENSSSFFRTLGVSVGYGRRLSWPDRYFNLYHELSYQAYFLKDWSNFVVTDGVSNIIQLNTTLSRNSVDQTIYPRSGSDFRLSLSLTPPYSLWDNNDYSDPNISSNDKYRFIEFHKWKLHSQWYTTLDNANKLVLTARLEMGYIGSYNRNKKSPFEGFQVGGDGMSGYNVYGVDIVGLRGYENAALTQPYLADGTVNYSTAYNKYVLELRYPIIMQSSSTIYGLVFAEAGNAFNSWKDFDPFQLKRSLGVGIRLYLPMIGTVGFDYGYGFDSAVGESSRSGGHPHFTMGTQF